MEHNGEERARESVAAFDRGDRAAFGRSATRGSSTSATTSTCGRSSPGWARCRFPRPPEPRYRRATSARVTRRSGRRRPGRPGHVVADGVRT